MATEQQKDDLIEVMYRKTAGELSKNVFMGEVQIHFDAWGKELFWETVEALVNDNLIVHRIKGWFAFTPEGRRRAKKILYPSPSLTQNTMTVGTAINSPIQQGGAHATMTQTVSYSTHELDDLRRLVDVFEKHLDDLALDAPAKRKAMAQVATIKAQLEDEPDPAIVKRAGSTLWSITEKVIAGLIVAGVTNPALWSQAKAIMLKLFVGS
jgi:hypothetical protein